jgi:hypothetical protein
LWLLKITISIRAPCDTRLRAPRRRGYVTGWFTAWRLNMFSLYFCLLIFMTQQSPSGLDLLIVDVWFLDHTQRRTTLGRTPLDEWSARRRDLYLTTHNTHNKHSFHRWNLNPQSQQASGRRYTP